MKKIHDPVEKLRQNPKSLRASINAKCWDCVGMDSDPAPKWRIGNCHMSDCGLFAVDPTKTTSHARCLLCCAQTASRDAQNRLRGWQSLLFGKCRG